MLLLLAFTLAGSWETRRLPCWLAQVPAVALVAPVATFFVYLASIGMFAEPMSHEGFILGYRSVIVNLRCVSQVDRGLNGTAEVRLKGCGELLPASRSYLHVSRQM